MSDEIENSVKVAVRCRPLSDREKERGAVQCVEIEENQITIIAGLQSVEGSASSGENKNSSNNSGQYGTPTGRASMLGTPNGRASLLGTPTGSPFGTPTRGSGRKRGKRVFSFDFAYGEDSAQQTVFEDIGKGVLDNAFSGYNASVFAYGQTGSGKTHTMLGASDFGEDAGLIPRICTALVEKLGDPDEHADDTALARAASTRYALEASYLEIYNEKCIDLLAPVDKRPLPQQDEPNNLRIREHPKKGPYVEDLTVLPVRRLEDIKRMMAIGEKARTTASTHMNSKSSRSHAIFTLVFTQTNIASDLCSATDTSSKINLVDLAGSERVGQSGVQGKHLKEAANINRSLHTLGRVINALSRAGESSSHSSRLVSTPGTSGVGSNPGTPNAQGPSSSGGSREVIPYRDSTLTWLLKPSLGGNSRTTMLATISPANFNHDESVTTLRYAQECSRVVNRAIINRDSNNEVIAELRMEIDLLRQRLAKQTETSAAMANLNEELQQHKRAVEIENIESKKLIEKVGQRYLTELKEKEARWDRDRKTFEIECREKTDRIGALETKLQDVETDLEATRALKADLEQAKADLEATVREHVETAVKHTEAIKWGEKQLEARAETIAARDKELESTRADLETARREAAEKETALEADIKAGLDAQESLRTDLDLLRDAAAKEKSRLSKNLEDISSAKARVDEDLSEARGENAALTEKVAALDAALEASEARISALEGERDELRESLEAERNALKKTERHVADLTEKFNQMQAESHARMESLSAQIAQLEGNLAEVNEAKSKLDEDLEQEKRLHDLAKASAEEEQAAKDAVMKELADLQETTGTKISALDADIAALSEKKSLLEADLASATEKVLSTESQVSQLSADLESVNKTLDGTREKAEQDVAALRSQLDETTTEKKANAQQVSKLEEDLAERTEDLKQTRETSETRAQQIADLEATVVEKKEAIERLEDSETALKDKVAGLEESLAAESTSLGAANETVAARDASIASLKQTIETCNEEIANLQTTRAELESQITGLEADLKTRNEELVEARQDIEAKAGEIGSLHDKVQGLESERDTLQTKITGLATELEELEMTRAQVAEELTSVTAKLETANAELAETRETVENLTNDLATKTQECESVSAKLAAIEASSAERIEGLEAESNAKSERIQELETAKSELESARDALQQTVDEQVAQLAVNLETIQLHETTISELEASKAGLEAETSDKQNTISLRDVTISDLEKTLADTKESLESELAKTREEASAKEEALSKDKVDLSAQIEACKAEIGELEEAKAAEIRKLFDLNAQHDELTAQHARVSADLLELQGNHETALAESKELAQKLSELEQAKSELEEAKAALESTKADLEASTKELENRVTDLEAAREALESANKELEQAKADACEARDGTQAEMAQLREEVSAEREAMVTRAEKLAEAEMAAQELEQISQERMESAENLDAEARALKASADELKQACDEESARQDTKESELRALAAETQGREEAMAARIESNQRKAKKQCHEELIFRRDTKETMAKMSSDHDVAVASMQQEHSGALERAAQAHASELERTKEDHEASLTTLAREHAAHVEQLENSHAASLEQKAQEHANEKATLLAEHEASLASAAQKHADELASLQEEHATSLAKAAEEHAAEVESLRRAHDEALEAQRMDFAVQKQGLTEAKLDLRRQLVEEKELRQREAERYASLFQSEEKEIERQIAQAQSQVDRLHSKLKSARAERELSQESLRQAEQKLEEREHRLRCDEMAAFKQWLMTTGVVLLKYPSTGKKPHSRSFLLTETASEAAPKYELVMSKVVSGRSLMETASAADKRIEMSTIEAIHSGCATETFQRSSAEALADRCFSIATSARTYDLQCGSSAQRDKLVHGFQMMMEEMDDPQKFRLVETIAMTTNADEDATTVYESCAEDGVTPRPFDLEDVPVAAGIEEEKESGARVEESPEQAADIDVGSKPGEGAQTPEAQLCPTDNESVAQSAPPEVEAETLTSPGSPESDQDEKIVSEHDEEERKEDEGCPAVDASKGENVSTRETPEDDEKAIVHASDVTSVDAEEDVRPPVPPKRVPVVDESKTCENAPDNGPPPPRPARLGSKVTLSSSSSSSSLVSSSKKKKRSSKHKRKPSGSADHGASASGAQPAPAASSFTSMIFSPFMKK